MRSIDVVQAAHTAHLRRHPPEPGLGPARTGRCGRCGTPGDRMTAIRQVVSNRFTGYHGWVNPRSKVLCAPCTWAYQHRPLRTDIHLVRRDHPTLEQLTDDDLASVLASPIPADTAVTVPARSGRKHLLPDAVWGHITAADTHLHWGPREVETLAAMTRLRAAGFTAADLAAAAPPFKALRTVDPDDVATTLEDWAILGPWRSAAPWWTVGLRASTPIVRVRR